MARLWRATRVERVGIAEQTSAHEIGRRGIAHRGDTCAVVRKAPLQRRGGIHSPVSPAQRERMANECSGDCDDAVARVRSALSPKI